MELWAKLISGNYKQPSCALLQALYTTTNILDQDAHRLSVRRKSILEAADNNIIHSETNIVKKIVVF